MHRYGYPDLKVIRILKWNVPSPLAGEGQGEGVKNKITYKNRWKPERIYIFFSNRISGDAD
jgi:hypothetical protein